MKIERLALKMEERRRNNVHRSQNKLRVEASIPQFYDEKL